ncbi:NAD(P)/FAD-dependent oxidoreductase [Streptomyces sp. NPDC057694]|uniref:NAD(P)/FAD-dependent oxidoreductase n=1 Tax=Streptomyces sp. NPDC057694 TaxID=3346216 RepID=UPI00369B5605
MTSQTLTPGSGHGHAVVIGASFAGLTAARALAGFMDRVTVIERDWMPQGHARRRGVRQARYPHPLMPTARQELERLFPGVGQDLERAGAMTVRMSDHLLLRGPDGWLPRCDTDLTLLSAGRDLIDAVLRERLRSDPTVAFLPEHEVVGLEPGRQDTVTGVWVRGHDRGTPRAPGPRTLLSADFVIDASGQGSHAPQWLAELGYGQVAETFRATQSPRAAAEFAPPVGHVASWRSLQLMPSPGHPGEGMLHPVEGGRWSVSLTGGATGTPPTDHKELLRAAGALGHPLLHDVISTASPLGPVYHHPATGSRWRHYERLRRFPDQFLVVGDALAALDPAHSQGMTLAVRSALTLNQLLTAHGTAIGLSRRLRQALAHQVASAWPPARPPRTPRARLRRWCAARIDAHCATDPRAAELVLERLATGGQTAQTLRPDVLRTALRAPAVSLAAPEEATRRQARPVRTVQRQGEAAPS